VGSGDVKKVTDPHCKFIVFCRPQDAKIATYSEQEGLSLVAALKKGKAGLGCPSPISTSGPSGFFYNETVSWPTLIPFTFLFFEDFSYPIFSTEKGKKFL
jgi:hypothetical protein